MRLRVPGQQCGAEWGPEEDQRSLPLGVLRSNGPVSTRCHQMLREHGHRYHPAAVTYLGPEGPVEVYVGNTGGDWRVASSERCPGSPMSELVARVIPEIDWRLDPNTP